MQLRSRTVLIVEPHLEDQAGHAYRYVRAFSASFARLGWGSLILSHRAYSGPKQINGAEIRPTFLRTYYEREDRRIGIPHTLTRSLRRFLKSLRKSNSNPATDLNRWALMGAGAAIAITALPAIVVAAIFYASWRGMTIALGRTSTYDTCSDFVRSVAREIENTTGELRLLVPTATPAMLAELLALPVLLRSPPPKMACVFHEDPNLYTDWYRPLDLGSLAYRLRGSGWKDSIRFFATNPQLATEMSAILDAPVCDFGDVFEEDEVACLGRISAGRHSPALDLFGSEADLLRDLSERKKSGKRLAVCLGAVRPDKGGKKLRSIVSGLDGASGAFDLVLQAARWPDSLRADCLALKGRKDIAVIERPLSEAAYLQLLNLADVVLLPYEAEAYRCRVSRVFIEASLAGRLVLASEGISAETDPAPSSARFISDWSEWPADAVKLVASTAPETIAQRASERIAGGSWSRWLEAAAWLCTPSLQTMGPKPVLYVRPSWFSTGSATVFDQQIRYLADTGLPVIEMIVVSDRDRRKQGSTFRATLADRASSSALVTCLSARRFGLTGSLQRRLFRIDTKGKSQAVFLAEQSRLSPIPQIVQEIASKQGLSFILVNHYFNLPFIKALKQKFPVWVETHDLQARQILMRGEVNRLTGRQDSFDDLVSDELSYLRQADVIGAINIDEEAFFRAQLGSDASKVILCQPSISLPPSGGPASGCDVLIVASDNLANVRSVWWFVHEVLPRLDPDRSIKIVGNIQNVAEREGLLHHQIQYVGVVEYLTPHYESARLVAMPIIAGTGIAIKALEALVAGRPIVASPLAYRGLPLHFHPPLPKPTTDALKFAANIDRLLNDSQALETAAQSTQAANSALGMRDQFEAQMADAVERLSVISRLRLA